jgi:hypothetical protein
MLTPNLAKEIEEGSGFYATPTHAAPGLLGSDPIRSMEVRVRSLFGLSNTASVYQELMQFESLSDLDRLLKFGKEGATACLEALVFDKYPNSGDDSEPFLGHHLGLTITSTPQGWFVYWKGMEPSELLFFPFFCMTFSPLFFLIWAIFLSFLLF